MERHSGHIIIIIVAAAAAARPPNSSGGASLASFAKCELSLSLLLARCSRAAFAEQWRQSSRNKIDSRQVELCARAKV